MDSSKLQTVINALVLCEGNKAKAARFLGMKPSTYKDAVNRALREGIEPNVWPEEDESLEDFSRDLRQRFVEQENRRLKEEKLSSSFVRHFITELKSQTCTPPTWVSQVQRQRGKVQGIPTLFLSDLHYGEVVKAEQVNGLNEYNLEVADRRLKNLLDNTIDLCFNHLNATEYPGIVLVLGGDMFSGDIHQELSESNEKAVLSLLLELRDKLVAFIEGLKERFGKVFVPCVYGNHGRLTKKPQFKNAAFTNYDWLLYNLLEKHFVGDKNVKFMVAEGYDLIFSIYDTTYLLTHGDRIGTGGGSGLIGVVSPIVRGASKITDQYEQMGTKVDYVLMGHYHQLMRVLGVIVNGSPKGYDEFAMGMRFKPEAPQQAMWITHHERGITHWVPVFCEGTSKTEPAKEWVSWG